jgi:hypothetical protein
MGVVPKVCMQDGDIYIGEIPILGCNLQCYASVVSVSCKINVLFENELMHL